MITNQGEEYLRQHAEAAEEYRLRAQHAMNQGKRRRKHQAVPSSVRGTCVCGRPMLHKHHEWVPEGERVRMFEPGDRVRHVEGQWTGKVESVTQHSDTKQYSIYVMWDTCQMVADASTLEPSAWLRPESLRLLVKPPKFASIEEAEAWMAANE